MKFFIDTANLEEIQKANELGLVDGVTTNPSLMAKESGDPTAIIGEICRLIPGPVSAEVVATDTPGMVQEARQLKEIATNVVVKIPMTLEGLSAVRQLAAEGIQSNVTLVFSPLQALLAAKAGAAYVSPFVGRLDDLAQDGMELVEQIMAVYDNYGFTTEVIVASVRNPMHVLNSALIGAHIATVPFGVLAQLAQHPLTDKGLKAFLQDWENRK